MKFIIGKKIEMTQIWQGENVMPVTKVQAGPCFVTQIKTKANDGYDAVQVGFGNKKEKNSKKPQLGHLKQVKAKGIADNFQFLREFIPNQDNKTILEIGDKIDVSAFAAGDIVAATGVSKGRGFQGVVKRHGFQGGRKSHGNKDQLRMPGSTGATGAGHVFKGTKKPGRMGTETTTTKNLEIIEIDKENNFLYVKGGIAGARNSLVLLAAPGDLPVTKPEARVREEIREKKEEINYKDFLVDNANGQDELLQKKDFLMKEKLIMDDKNKCWYFDNKQVFTEEDVDDHNFESLKKSWGAYKKDNL